MDQCCGCLRKWSTIERKDPDKYHYEVTDVEMARFYSDLSRQCVGPGSEICKRRQLNCCSKKKAQSDARRGYISQQEDESEVGPSGYQLGQVHDEIEEVVTHMSSSSLSPPSIFSPSSFTPIPRTAGAFLFPPTNDQLDSSSDGDDESDNESTDEEHLEDVHVLPYRVSTSSHQTCIFGCQGVELRRVADPHRAEILLIHQIYIPAGARVCQQRWKSADEPNTIEGEWTLQQAEDALLLHRTRIEKNSKNI